MESAVLFTPQVYTNKQMLGGSNAKRNISSIAGVEMMLRQILMNQTQAVGKRFEMVSIVISTSTQPITSRQRLTSFCRKLTAVSPKLASIPVSATILSVRI
jgi:hypothetical protein